jgi:hypothetical protein
MLFSPILEDLRYETGNSFPGGLCSRSRLNLKTDGSQPSTLDSHNLHFPAIYFAPHT